MSSPVSNTPTSQQLIPYLSSTFFCENREIAETVQEYNEGLSLDYLVENIINNNKSKKSEELLQFIFESARLSRPDLSIDDLRTPEKLRSVFLLLEAGNSNNTFYGMKIRTISFTALVVINDMHPLNIEDPITLDEPEEGDLIETDSGHRFSLASLVTYHNSRPYKGTRGEQFGNKFLFNVLTNNYFSHKDSNLIIIQALRSGHKLIHLHKGSLAHPDIYVPERYKRVYKSLNAYYLSLREAGNRLPPPSAAAAKV